jgi:TPR repeat protein
VTAIAEESTLETVSTIDLATHTEATDLNGTKAFDEAAALYKQNNFPAAFAAFTRLAEKGDARSQTILALMYKFGEGTQIDTQKAFTLYQMAAEQGYAPAQFRTGELYAEGLDIGPNLNKAEFWLNQAAKQGFDRAQSTLVEVQESRRFISRDISSKPIEKNGHLSEINKQSLQTRRTKNWDLRLPLNYFIENEQQTPKNKNPTTVENDYSTKVKTYSAQIGAMTSKDSANNLWIKLGESHPELFKDLKPQISISRESTGITYRIRTGEFLTYNEAQNFCNILLENERYSGCIEIKQQ